MNRLQCAWCNSNRCQFKEQGIIKCLDCGKESNTGFDGSYRWYTKR